MDKTSIRQRRTGLRSNKIIIQKPNKYFSDTEKHHIIQEFLETKSTKAAIWQKYTGHEDEHGQLRNQLRHNRQDSDKANPS